jgi:flagellar biosynthetic protein FliP
VSPSARALRTRKTSAPGRSRGPWRRDAAIILAFSGALAAFMASDAAAQTISVNLGTGQGVTARAVQLIAALTVLSLAPSILIMTTAFVRIVVVLSLLRSAIGLQQAPPNAVLISLAMFLTFFVMQPTFEESYQAGVRPLMQNEMTVEEAFPRATEPLKVFMLGQTREQDLELFVRLSKIETPDTAQDLPFRVVAPAFMISELKRAFEIGFMLFVPFLVIDLVVAALLMSMGMMMVPPVMISLPFKLIFFALVDGWRLVAGSLVESFATGPPAG